MFTLAPNIFTSNVFVTFTKKTTLLNTLGKDMNPLIPTSMG